MSVSGQEGGRQAQRDWTRSAILTAANELMRQGRTPSVSEAAEAAGLSRATAYRYFPTQGALLLAAVEHAVGEGGVSIVEEAQLMPEASERVEHVARRFLAETIAHQHQFRALLAYMLEQWLVARGGEQPEALARGRRILLLTEALEPLRDRLPDAELRRLTAVLSTLIGIESWTVLSDMWQMTPEEAQDAIAWASRALLAAAQGDV